MKVSRIQIENDAAKKHLLMALDEFDPLPEDHNHLIKRLREYFEGQKIEVFSKVITRMGEADFRDFIADAVVESGKYYRDEEDGQIRVRKQTA